MFWKKKQKKIATVNCHFSTVKSGRSCRCVSLKMRHFSGKVSHLSIVLFISNFQMSRSRSVKRQLSVKRPSIFGKF